MRLPGRVNISPRPPRCRQPFNNRLMHSSWASRWMPRLKLPPVETVGIAESTVLSVLFAVGRPRESERAYAQMRSLLTRRCDAVQASQRAAFDRVPPVDE